jgi:hypothetical protein
MWDAFEQVAAVDRPKRRRTLGSLRGVGPLQRQLSFGVRRQGERGGILRATEPGSGGQL